MGRRARGWSHSSSLGLFVTGGQRAPAVTSLAGKHTRMHTHTPARTVTLQTCGNALKTGETPPKKGKGIHTEQNDFNQFAKWWRGQKKRKTA